MTGRKRLVRRGGIILADGHVYRIKGMRGEMLPAGLVVFVATSSRRAGQATDRVLELYDEPALDRKVGEAIRQGGDRL